MTTIEQLKDQNNGVLPAYAWPGGYPLYYTDKGDNVVCRECACREVDQSQDVIAYEVNWEDENLYCDDCGAHIQSAYGE